MNHTQNPNITPRPEVKSKTVDPSHPAIQKLVTEYARWSEDPKFENSSKEDYEKDILSCFDEWDLDGYQLTKHLESSVYLEGNSELVGILDGFYFIKREVEKDMNKKWVKENNLSLDHMLLGRKVTYKQNLHKGSGYITTIDPETYRVTVSSDISKVGGYIMNFENVTLEN